jgi:hypothetical protein
MTVVAKKKRRRKAPVMAAPRRRRTHHHKAPAKRRRRLSSGAPTGGMKGMFMNGVKGGAGGAIHVAPKFVMKLETPVQIAWDIMGTMGLAYFKWPQVAAGFAGAAVSDHIQEQFKKEMHDDFQDAEWVHPDTLSDSGFDDDDGNPLEMDDDGNLYALNDDGDYEHYGHMDDFQGGMNDMDGINGVSMLPLQSGNPYALSNPYALQQEY